MFKSLCASHRMHVGKLRGDVNGGIAHSGQWAPLPEQIFVTRAGLQARDRCVHDRPTRFGHTPGWDRYNQQWGAREFLSHTGIVHTPWLKRICLGYYRSREIKGEIYEEREA